MARTDFVALVTGPSTEYVAQVDLERFCLRPYLPQQCRRIQVDGTIKLRRFPLFPRYLLLPYQDLDYRLLRNTRGILKANPVLTSREGQVWRAPLYAIEQIRHAEESGDYDEKLQKGVKVRIKGKAFTEISAFIEVADRGMVELFTPLLGGSRLRTRSSNVVIATVP